ncbi:MAG TPA: carbonic anhydrase [Vicinamibacteria bacterium]|nr:carbonic anhydrase [Vicinamibacteria bacterium]
MHFEEILERNRRFVAGRAPHPLPPPSPAALIVVSCFDPRLDGLMAPALGLEGEKVLWFRTAGAFVPRESTTIRSLLVKIFLFEVRAIVVVGHSSCRMASFDAESFIASFRERGVDRDAFGPGDLRDWAGAIGSPRQGVELTVENILSHPARPADLVVNGAVLDDTRGVLEPVVRAPDVK